MDKDNKALLIILGAITTIIVVGMMFGRDKDKQTELLHINNGNMVGVYTLTNNTKIQIGSNQFLIFRDK
jgi:hypothetical protein